MSKLGPSKARRFRLLPVAVLLALASAPLASTAPVVFGTLVSIFPDGFEQGDVCEWSNAASFEVPWYLDGDGDTYGNPNGPIVACRRPAGRVDNPLDCNDSDPAIHPGAIDICLNGIDENCDGEDANTVDVDGDGWSTCDGDCDDHDDTIHPGAVEVCNGVDDDCDQIIDEGCSPFRGPARQ
jgi:hypothetical protein